MNEAVYVRHFYCHILKIFVMSEAAMLTRIIFAQKLIHVGSCNFLFERSRVVMLRQATTEGISLWPIKFVCFG